MSNFDPSVYDSVPAPTEGNFPEIFKFTQPGENVTGTLVDVRRMDGKGDMQPCIVHDIEVAPGQRLSVLCSTTSQRRLVNAKRPVPGQQIRWTFVGFEGQAKIYTLDVDGSAPAAPAPATAPAPQPAAVGGQVAPSAAPAWGAAPAAPETQAPPAAAPATPAWG